MQDRRYEAVMTIRLVAAALLVFDFICALACVSPSVDRPLNLSNTPGAGSSYAVTVPPPSSDNNAPSQSLPASTVIFTTRSTTAPVSSKTNYAGELDLNGIGPLILVADNFKFTEGPVWDKTRGVLLFSDIDASKIFQLKPPNMISIFHDSSNGANGLAFDVMGRLLAAEHASRSLTLTLQDGSVDTLAASYQGKQLNSPNDIAVRSDGTIYFSDPVYGLAKRPPGVDFMGLYRLNSAGQLFLEGQFDKSPNGVVLSPDQKTLYLALTAGNEILAFDINADGSTANARRLAALPQPDGMAVDLAGNIYTAGAQGIYIFSPAGIQQKIIYTDHQPTNCEFGGNEGNLLFITAREAVYYVKIPVRGF